ncbi:unnamed protein product [Blepharisma stoltei]|uniref:Uncharacterized protein n=1 Tax=Blepharisma stoltei TaxID=1481888 RepID=A0AAU9IHW9_9CILI|nr:unnamed protein product [Blepharisma stoltei]
MFFTPDLIMILILKRNFRASGEFILNKMNLMATSKIPLIFSKSLQRIYINMISLTKLGKSTRASASLVCTILTLFMQKTETNI